MAIRKVNTNNISGENKKVMSGPFKRKNENDQIFNEEVATDNYEVYDEEDIYEDDTNYEDEEVYNDEYDDLDMDDTNYEQEEEQEEVKFTKRNTQPVKENKPETKKETKSTLPAKTKSNTEKPKQQKPKQKEKEETKNVKTEGEKLIKKYNPLDYVESGKVTKREDLMKMAMCELRKAGYGITLDAMLKIFKAIENSMELSLSNDAPIVLLGNQMQKVYRKRRVSSGLKQDYDTLTFDHTAYSWRKLGERKTIRGVYDKENKVFTAEDGTKYDI